MLMINGHNIYVEITGPQDVPVVVLLHHGLGSARAWRGQVPAFVQAGFRVLVYDRWGYAGSEARPALDLPTFTTDVKDLQEILRLCGISTAALVGHSDGGTIALYYAASHPRQVSCLVTVAAHIYLEAKMEPAFLAIRKNFETDERFRKGLQHAHGEKYASVFHNWFDGWHRQEFLSWDMRPILSQISCPTLIVQGENDEHATPQHARDIANAITGADLWILPEARHMLPQENTAEFNPKIIRFLQEHTLVENHLTQRDNVEQQHV